MKFGKWDIDETSDYCSKRLKSAASVECTPLGVAKETDFAVFSGNHGIYNTTLDSCNCYDFAGASQPCKHILRLAMEKGLISFEYESDLNAVKYPKEAIEKIKTVYVDVETGEAHDKNPLPEGALAGLTFVLTGTFSSYTKDEIHGIIDKAGGRVAGSVSRRTSYLVSGEEPGSKLLKAKEYGIPVISDKELIEMIG